MQALQIYFVPYLYIQCLCWENKLAWFRFYNHISRTQFEWYVEIPKEELCTWFISQMKMIQISYFWYITAYLTNSSESPFHSYMRVIILNSSWDMLQINQNVCQTYVSSKHDKYVLYYYYYSYSYSYVTIWEIRYLSL